MSKALNEKWKDRFIRTLQSAIDYDVSDRIKDIKVPTLIISSELDTISFTGYQEFIHNQIENSSWVTIKEAGHAALAEKPEEYISIVMEFLRKLDKVDNEI
jgi:pimeloyl-ACP methyl ester carboxylesterase